VVAEDVTEVDGTLNVVGNLNVSGPAVITGTLSLPAGIIDNAALASPVVPQSVNFTSSNFAIGTAVAVRASSTITVPAGFTSAVVTVIARVLGFNPNTTAGSNGTGGDWLYIAAQIDTAVGIYHGDVVLGSNDSNISVDGLSTVLTGLTGGDTFMCKVNVCSGLLDWGTSVNNAAEMSGTILWFR